MALLSRHADDCGDVVDTAADVFDKYGDFVRAVIRHNVGNTPRADDLFQDFFLSLIHRPIPPDVRNIRAYLYRAITNDIRDATRRTKNYRKHIRIYAKPANYFINNKTPENASIEVEEINRMCALIERQLPRREAQAVIARYGNNCDIKEIAAEMDVDYRTVARYISKGLKKIRQFFAAK